MSKIVRFLSSGPKGGLYCLLRVRYCVCVWHKLGIHLCRHRLLPVLGPVCRVSSRLLLKYDCLVTSSCTELLLPRATVIGQVSYQTSLGSRRMVLVQYNLAVSYQTSLGSRRMVSVQYNLAVGDALEVCHRINYSRGAVSCLHHSAAIEFFCDAQRNQR